MLTTALIAAAAMAQGYGTPPQAPIQTAPTYDVKPIASTAPTATAGRTLKDLPGTTITYYDIAGKTGPAIEKSLKKLHADPASKDVVRLLNWDVDTQIVKQTKGATCTIQSAKSTLKAEVRLPRLAEAKIANIVLANWNAYTTRLENEAATNLWFVSDRLRGAEQSLVGISCDQAAPVWNAKVESVKTQLNEFLVQRAQSSSTPAG